MMFSNLYAWLILHKELAVPGIGTFSVNREAAVLDFPNKKILPPSYSIRMDSDSYTPGQDFFNWLAGRLSISPREAIFRFNEFVFELKKNISEGTIVDWNGVGQIRKGEADEMEFHPGPVISEGFPISAEKIIREKARHKVLVGEMEKTSEEMTDLLEHEEEKRSFWWVYALSVAVLALMFTGWWLSENGISVANIEKSAALESSPATYRVLP